MLRSKIASMREYMESAELEHKASRETILRLVTEAEREQKSSNKYCLEIDAVRMVSGNFIAYSISSFQSLCQSDKCCKCTWIHCCNSLRSEMKLETELLTTSVRLSSSKNASMPVRDHGMQLAVSLKRRKVAMLILMSE